jgi:hypothetical protein
MPTLSTVKQAQKRAPQIRFLNVSDGAAYQILGRSLQTELEEICGTFPNASMRCDQGETQDGRRTPAWRKLELISKELEDPSLSQNDWIVWVDSDVVVLNPKLDPSEFLRSDKDVLISIDAYGICTGVFAVRATDWCRTLVDALLLLGPIDSARVAEFDGYDRHEQNSLKVLLRYFPEVRNRFDLIPDSVIQNRRSQYSADAWMFHFWMGGRTVEEVVDKRRLIRDKGWTQAVFTRVIRFETQTGNDVNLVASRAAISPPDLWRMISPDSVRDLDSEKPLSVWEAENLLRFSNLVDTALRIFGDRAKARSWLFQPFEGPAGTTPADSITNEREYHLAESRLASQLPDPLLGA